MSAPPRPSRLAGAWQRVTDRWNHTPGYLKWLGGLLLGALVRLAFARLFPERWEKVSHRLLDPTMPIWLALALVAAILLVERLVPPLYRRLRSARGADAHVCSVRRALGRAPLCRTRPGSLLHGLHHPAARSPLGRRGQPHAVGLPLLRPRVQHP